MLSAQTAVRNSEVSQRISGFQRASVADGATLTARVFRSSNNGDDNSQLTHRERSSPERPGKLVEPSLSN